MGTKQNYQRKNRTEKHKKKALKSGFERKMLRLYNTDYAFAGITDEGRIHAWGLKEYGGMGFATVSPGGRSKFDKLRKYGRES